MKREVYESMSPHEKIMYDEFCDFSMKLAARIEALTQAMQKLLEIARDDP